ncbi:MAG: amidohydrolase [Actinobacteria bacterium]|nr:MAG: amidohydrolase [Actinomycetota bacterium]
MTATASAAKANGMRFIDSDGHVLEHPTEMQRYAPTGFEDRVWHIETDAKGDEWIVMDGRRQFANPSAQAGTAGMTLEDRERAARAELKYTEVRPAAYNAKARLDDMTTDHIDQSVLYPTSMLGIQAYPDVEFADVQCRAYNDWLSDHVQDGDGRLFGVAVVPQQDLELAAKEIRRTAKLPGIVGAFIRPNPSEDWKPFSHPVYNPLWEAASDSGMALGLHPFLAADLPGACLGLRIHHLGTSAIPTDERAAGAEGVMPVNFDNIFFTQAISNPFDMMNSMAFLLAGGVCEQFPDLKIVFLEANGGWLVPWLERLDHHYKIFAWDVPTLKMEPSAYFRRQCWISFDPDESALPFTANSPLCGADRIVWASDYPHPDAKYPGVTDELVECIESLTDEQQRQIAGDNTTVLYGL